MSLIPNDSLFQIFIFLEPNEIFSIITKVSKDFHKVVYGPSFLENLYKINVTTPKGKEQDYFKLFQDIYKKIRSFNTDIISWAPNPKESSNRYHDVLMWIIINNYHKLLKSIFREKGIYEEISKLVIDNPTLETYKRSLFYNENIKKFHPPYFLQQTVLADAYECCDVILDYFDKPLLKLNNPLFLFINSYHDLSNPIHTCAYNGKLDFLKHLENKRANMKSLQLHYGQTILHIATSKNLWEIVEYILSNKIIDVDEIDQDGWTPLHIAASKGHIESTEILLKYGAKKNFNTGFGTPLTLAKMKGFGQSFQKYFQN